MVIPPFPRQHFSPACPHGEVALALGFAGACAGQEPQGPAMPSPSLSPYPERGMQMGTGCAMHPVVISRQVGVGVAKGPEWVGERKENKGWKRAVNGS